MFHFDVAGRESDGAANQSPSTLEATGNRSRSTADDEGILPVKINYGAPGYFAQPVGALPVFCWKAGTELPPFVPTNAFAISMLVALADGTIDSVPSVAVSEAVAVQIWCLIFAKGVQVEALRHVDYRGYYTILASFVFGTCVLAVDPKRVDALRVLLTRKGWGSGLIPRFRHFVGQRTKGSNALNGKSVDAARALLLCEWDKKPLDFDFGAAHMVAAGAASSSSSGDGDGSTIGAGGGGGGGGGGGSGGY
jgi:hypothetical protein